MSENKLDINITGDPGTDNTFSQQIAKDGGIIQNLPNVTTNVTVANPKSLCSFTITEIINRLDECAQDMPSDDDYTTDPFYIEAKIALNELDSWKEDIAEYTAYSGIVNRIYGEFDKQGRNKSRNVLKFLKNQYRRLKGSYHADALFDQLLDNVCNAVSGDLKLSKNIRYEDLEYNARIVLVDAFIKCEIFEKPKGTC